MTAIMLCGEGHHDVGLKEWNKKTGDHVWLEGWMQPLVRKARPEVKEVKIRYLKELFLSPRPKALRPALKGQGDKAAIAKLVAKLEGCDTVVYMTDADTNVPRERKLKVDEIEQGFAVIDNDVVCVPCVPMGTSESWLLCDIEAWKALGLIDESCFPKENPEDLWGLRNDPNGNHPKNTFARMATNAGLDDNRETRREICEKSSVDVMKRRCPLSLSDFTNKLVPQSSN